MADKLKSKLAEVAVRKRTLVGVPTSQLVASEPDADVETAWDAELERRAEMMSAGTATGEPAEQVFAELRNRIFAGRKI